MLNIFKEKFLCHFFRREILQTRLFCSLNKKQSCSETQTHKREASIWCVFIITVRRLWPDGRNATLDKLQSHFCALGSFSVKSNLESARNFPSIHICSQKVAAGFVVCFQDQILSSENHSPSVISLNTCHQLTMGLVWTWRKVQRACTSHYTWSRKCTSERNKEECIQLELADFQRAGFLTVFSQTSSIYHLKSDTS